MPAAAVIPAPIAYIKVVAVKKLVVGFLLRTTGPASCSDLVASTHLWCEGTRLKLAARTPEHLL